MASELVNPDGPSCGPDSCRTEAECFALMPFPRETSGASIKDQGLTLLIGATGSIGQKLCSGLLDRFGDFSVVVAVRRTPMPPGLAHRVHVVEGVDIREASTLQKIFDAHPNIKTVWNLAAPLSVDTAKDPANAHNVTVGGMERLLTCCVRNGVERVCFTDSIGSFGHTAPRVDAPARWLVENPAQDPGSDYGRQKCECRELLSTFSKKYGLDTRWAVVPGVLHTDTRWGGGTTEYAMDAVKAAVEERVFECPVPLDATLPMIHVSDLVAALIKLQSAPRSQLRAPEAGYCIRGFSFSPRDLFRILKAEYFPKFSFKVPPEDSTEQTPAAVFANTWPDSIDGTAAAHDLEFTSQRTFKETLSMIVDAHRRYFGKQRSRL
eukprot:INCI8222.1.p1 GENE.INCI8222.1~~INCI8222.1.p1  ORF type:complete len:379 (+),score=48.61 INCI8222.1:131-1267(+)